MRRARRHEPPPRSTIVARGCGGKRQYGSFKEAELMAKRTRRDRESRVAPYRCRHCHFFHVGERPAKQDRRHAGR